jgi:hypothetical protein
MVWARVEALTNSISHFSVQIARLVPAVATLRDAIAVRMQSLRIARGVSPVLPAHTGLGSANNRNVNYFIYFRGAAG